MDGGVSDGKIPEASTPETYSDIFDEVFPQYLMMGMSPEEYWDGENGLLRAYREAFIQRAERTERERDAQAWLIGRYVRDALQSVYLLVNGFVPKGAEAHPYPERPYLEQAEQKQKEERHRAAAEKKRAAEDAKVRQSMAYFQAAVAQYNRNFRKRQEQEAARKAKTGPETEGT